jgi:hypothetical protein
MAAHDVEGIEIGGDGPNQCVQKAKQCISRPSPECFDDGVVLGLTEAESLGIPDSGIDMIHHGKREEVCHGAAVGLRDDYDAETLRRLVPAASDAGQVPRLLALAAIYTGGTRGEAAAIGGVGLQTVRDWVLRTQRRKATSARGKRV